MANVIYKIINVVNNKFYVGSTNNMLQRAATHRKRLRAGKHHAKHLQSAWNKYGEASFVFAVVETLPDDVSLFEAEDRWLAEHYGKEYCYNASRYADAPMRGRIGALHFAYGSTMPDDQRNKVSAGLKKYYAEGGTHPRLGQSLTEESRAKISASRKGKNAGSEHYRFGKTLSEEVRKKIGDAQRGKPKKAGRRLSPEGRAKIAAAVAAGHFDHWTGRKHTTESRLKMSKPVREVTSGRVFASLTETLQHYKMTMPTLTRALKSGEPIGPKSRYAGLVFKYEKPLDLSRA